MSSSKFYNNLLISSMIPFKTEKYSIISPPSRRHSFLNGLALSLNGSKSCTSVYPWLKNKQILISCNESLTKQDKIYFDRFFGLIRLHARFCLSSDRDGMNETYSLLKSLVFERNKEKCLKRMVDPLFDDALSKLEELLNHDRDEICAILVMNKKMNKGSADYAYLIEKKLPLNDYISILFRWINDIFSIRNSVRKDKSNLDLEMIEEFQTKCELLYHSKIFQLITSFVYPIPRDHDRILYYLDKSSGHIRSLDLLLKCLEQRPAEYGQVYKNIQWKFLEPIETIVHLDEKPSLTFDQIWLDCGLPDDQTKSDFKQQFIANRFNEYDQNFKLPVCLHCEIRMIDHLIEQNIHEVHDDNIEIGISKLSCYSCSLYIDKLNDMFNRSFCVAKSTTHGKIYPKWTFRNNEDHSIITYVNDQLCALIKKALKDLQRDSQKKSGDSDKQETDLDDDDIDNTYMHLKINKMMEN